MAPAPLRDHDDVGGGGGQEVPLMSFMAGRVDDADGRDKGGYNNEDDRRATRSAATAASSAAAAVSAEMDGGADAVPLCDEDAMLDALDIPLAHGYIVLLGGGMGRKKKKKKQRGGSTGTARHDERSPADENALSLGFVAITEGNVVDACFGVVGTTGGGHARGDPSRYGGGDDRTNRLICEAKVSISDAAFTCDNVEALAVETYLEAFHIVLRYREKLRGPTGLLTLCCCGKRYRRKAKKKLAFAFAQLQEAIMASTT